MTHASPRSDIAPVVFGDLHEPAILPRFPQRLEMQIACRRVRRRKPTKNTGLSPIFPEPALGRSAFPAVEEVGVDFTQPFAGDVPTVGELKVTLQQFVCGGRDLDAIGYPGGFHAVCQIDGLTP